MSALTSKGALEANFGASGAIAEAGWTSRTSELRIIVPITSKCFMGAVI